MNVDARTATASDFDVAAQSAANQTWFWGIAATAVGFLAGWFALIPGGIAAWCVVKSVSATSMAGKLRAGTYPIPNPNNGAPDGNYRNLSGSVGSDGPAEDDATQPADADGRPRRGHR